MDDTAAWGKQQALQAHLASAQMEFKNAIKSLPPKHNNMCKMFGWFEHYSSKINDTNLIFLQLYAFSQISYFYEPGMDLFNQKYGKICNILKYYYNLK